MSASQEIAKREPTFGQLKLWHRLDLQARTTKTSMKHGPHWSDVIGRVVVDADTGMVLKKEEAKHITRNSEHVLLPDGPRNTLTLLLYKDGADPRNKVAQNKVESRTGIAGNVVLDDGSFSPGKSS